MAETNTHLSEVVGSATSLAERTLVHCELYCTPFIHSFIYIGELNFNVTTV